MGGFLRMSNTTLHSLCIPFDIAGDFESGLPWLDILSPPAGLPSTWSPSNARSEAAHLFHRGAPARVSVHNALNYIYQLDSPCVRCYCVRADGGVESTIVRKCAQQDSRVGPDWS